MTRWIAAALTLTFFFTPTAHADGPQSALEAVRDSRGHYLLGGGTLAATDCSGLVGIAQSIAMGEPPHRLGDTQTLLPGRWPGIIPGASPDDRFIIGASREHMVARIDGVTVEATTPGQPYRIGDGRSPFTMPAVYHVDPGLLV